MKKIIMFLFSLIFLIGCGTSEQDKEIEIDDYGYAKLKYTMMDRNLNTIGTNLEEMYNFNIKYLNRNNEEEYRRYIEKLKDPRYHRVVDELQ